MFPKTNYFSEMFMSLMDQTGGICTSVCSLYTHQEQEQVSGIPEEHRAMPIYRYLKARNAFELCI